MEHRHSKRVDVNLDVVFYSDGMPVAVGKTKNASQGGIFVETEYEPGNAKLVVEISLVLSNGVETGIHRVKSLIIHRTRDGIGLVIDYVGPQTQTMNQMLDTSASRQERRSCL